MGDDLIDSMTGNGNGGTLQHQRGGPRVPVGESREDKFVRLALQRMPNVQKHMRLVGNLATYPHTEAQRAKILGELRALVEEVEAAFEPKHGRDRFNF
jgi:hypothetical protein